MNYADALQCWQKVQASLKRLLGNAIYSAWFETLHLHSAENGKVVIWSDSTFYMMHIRTKYLSQLSTVVRECFADEYEVVLTTKDEAEKLTNKKEENHSNINLNPKYTFDTFVVGESNRFAHMVSVAVAAEPGTAYNPLFLYGGVGLGKTHLMNAIAHSLLENKPESRIVFTTSEKFTTDIIEAIAKKRTTEFKERMRQVDLLMIDDIQFIANKQATQEEFFHTFNAIHENGKQIVISSDRPPKELQGIEERLVSRFSWGMVADIQKPDYETRMAILLSKAENENIDIDHRVVSYIAEVVDTNIRELEGSFNRISALARMDNVPITLELAQKALMNISRPREEKKVSAITIMDAVAKYYNITRADILSERRSREVAVPRQLAIYLTRDMTQSSTTMIGAEFKRDHATIMHAIKKMTQKIELESDFAAACDAIRRSILE